MSVKEGRAVRPRVSALGWHIVSLVCALGVTAFYLWTLHSARGDLRIGPGKQDYYNLLVDGFQAGHLHMATPVDPALLALPVKQRPGNAPYLLDASLYEGRYYLYFGVMPAVLLHWPFTALTGRDLPDALAAWVIALVALGAGFLWWLELRRQLWPSLGPSLDWLVILALGFGTGVPAVLRRPLFYEEATLAGWLFGAVMLWALLRAQGARDRGVGWLILAGVACGFAVGSRANLVLAAVATLAVGAWLAGRRFDRGFRRGVLPALALAAAGALPVGLALAGYNLARFGSILEFGHTYQLGDHPEKLFRVTNLTHNIGLYYVRPPGLNAYFPYVLPPAETAKPADYIGRESVHGEWLWLVAALVVAPAVRFARRSGGWLAVPMLAWFAGNLLVTGLLGVRANRYMLDFHPALVCATLAGLAWLATRTGMWHRIWRGLITILVLVAAVFNVLASFQVHGFFSRSDPAGYERVGRAFDAVVWRTAPWLFDRVGDWETSLRWPPRGEGGVLLFLTAGAPEFRDLLWLRLDGYGTGAFEFAHRDFGSVKGPTFAYRPGETARLRLSGALLLPPVWHEWYGTRAQTERTAQRRRLRLWLDDELVFNRDVPSFATTPEWIEWNAFQEGQVRVMRPDAAWLDGLRARRGTVRLRLRLPGDRFGSNEPLLQCGTLAAWDVVMVRFTRPGYARVVHDSGGQGAVVSEEFAVDYDAEHLVEIESPVLNDGLAWNRHDTLEDRPVERLSVRWNGRGVLDSSLRPHPTDIAAVAIGVNDFASSGRASYAEAVQVAPLLDQLPAQWAATWSRPLDPAAMLEGERGILLHWRRRDHRQAAVVWRRPPGGDAVQLGWLDNGQVWWAERTIPSQSAALEYHLAPGPASAAEGGQPELVTFRLSWAGNEWLTGYTDFFAGEPDSVHGFDGASWRVSPRADPVSRGGISSERGTEERLPGRIRMHLALPSGGLRESAPLLTAGRTGQADAIFLRPVGADTYVVGLDHWGVAAYESRPLQVSPGKRIELTMELGSLFEDDGFAKDRVRVTLDGEVVLDVRSPLHPVEPDEVSIGRNPLGFSTSGERFPGQIFSVRRRVP